MKCIVLKWGFNYKHSSAVSKCLIINPYMMGESWGLDFTLRDHTIHTPQEYICIINDTEQFIYTYLIKQLPEGLNTSMPYSYLFTNEAFNKNVVNLSGDEMIVLLSRTEHI